MLLVLKMMRQREINCCRVIKCVKQLLFLYDNYIIVFVLGDLSRGSKSEIVAALGKTIIRIRPFPGEDCKKNEKMSLQLN